MREKGSQCQESVAKEGYSRVVSPDPRPRLYRDTSWYCFASLAMTRFVIHWIPAFAGITEGEAGTAVGDRVRRKRDRSDMGNGVGMTDKCGDDRRGAGMTEKGSQ
jgi:hypothetical protein